MPPAPPPAAPGDGPSRLQLGQVPWLELAGLAVLLAAIVVPLVFFGGPSQSPAGSEPASPSPAAAIPRTSFQFDAVSVRISALGGPQAFGASHDAGENIRTSLSRFYDQAFVDPATWAKGVPTSAWNVFSPSVRGRAEQDATSLALGTQVPGLAQLFVSQASLSVRVLVDPRGHIQLSAADVQFGATGELQDGRFVVVMNRASFLFKSESGRWMIVGYPIASIDLLGGPSASPAPSSSVSPTPTASGATP